MLNIISVPIGLFALLIALVGLVPLLGWLNWFAILVAGGGVLIGAMSAHKIGRNLNLAVIVIAGLRLMLGGGII